MESSKPFLVKNILEMNDDVPEEKEANIEDDTAKEIDASETAEEQQEGQPETAGSQINRRKVRRCFRAEQLEYLERCFMEAIYPEASMRKRIAQELKVSNDRVQVWFQNRRAKARKYWKQQYCSSTLPRISPQNVSKQPLLLDPHVRFASPFSQYSQLHREFHTRRIDRRNPMISMLPFEGHRVQQTPAIPMCSCYPVPRSASHFKPYGPRLSQSPTPPTPQRHCRCLPLRPRPNCMP